MLLKLRSYGGWVRGRIGAQWTLRKDIMRNGIKMNTGWNFFQDCRVRAVWIKEIVLVHINFMRWRFHKATLFNIKVAKYSTQKLRNDRKIILQILTNFVFHCNNALNYTAALFFPGIRASPAARDGPGSVEERWWALYAFPARSFYRFVRISLCVVGCRQNIDQHYRSRSRQPGCFNGFKAEPNSLHKLEQVLF